MFPPDRKYRSPVSEVGSVPGQGKRLERSMRCCVTLEHIEMFRWELVVVEAAEDGTLSYRTLPRLFVVANAVDRLLNLTSCCQTSFLLRWVR